MVDLVRQVMDLAQKMVAVVVPGSTVEFWAMCSAFGTFLVAWVALRGLRSLRLARADIVTRAERAAKLCAIERCEEWAREIIPANQSILEDLRKHGAQPFVSKPSEVRFNEPEAPKDLEAAFEWVNSLPTEVYPAPTIALLNRVEAWSAYFVEGIADSGVAEEPIAPTFCSFVVQNYAHLVLCRFHDGSGDYPHTVRLFEAWWEHLERKKRSDLMKNLGERLMKLADENQPRNPLPPPIGTDLDI